MSSNQDQTKTSSPASAGWSLWFAVCAEEEVPLFRHPVTMYSSSTNNHLEEGDQGATPFSYSSSSSSDSEDGTGLMDSHVAPKRRKVSRPSSSRSKRRRYLRYTNLCVGFLPVGYINVKVLFGAKDEHRDANTAGSCLRHQIGEAIRTAYEALQDAEGSEERILHDLHSELATRGLNDCSQDDGPMVWVDLPQTAQNGGGGNSSWQRPGDQHQGGYVDIRSLHKLVDVERCFRNVNDASSMLPTSAATTALSTRYFHMADADSQSSVIWSDIVADIPPSCRDPSTGAAFNTDGPTANSTSSLASFVDTSSFKPHGHGITPTMSTEQSTSSQRNLFSPPQSPRTPTSPTTLHDSLHQSGFLGRGATGSVLQGSVPSGSISTTTGVAGGALPIPVAVKMMRVPSDPSSKRARLMQREVRVMNAMCSLRPPSTGQQPPSHLLPCHRPHPNIVGYCGAFKVDGDRGGVAVQSPRMESSQSAAGDDATHVAIVMELCNLGSLSSCIGQLRLRVAAQHLASGRLPKPHQHRRGDGALTVAESLPIIAAVASALSYLHGPPSTPSTPLTEVASLSTPHIHRDIKPQNILLSNSVPWPLREEHASVVDVGNMSHRPTTSVCLADFGITQHHSLVRTSCGTRTYMAPEVLYVRSAPPSHRPSGSPPYTASVDIFSLGVVLQHLLTDGHPDALRRQWTFTKSTSHQQTMAWTNASTSMPQGQANHNLMAWLDDEATACTEWTDTVPSFAVPRYLRCDCCTAAAEDASAASSSCSCGGIGEDVVALVNCMVNEDAASRPTADMVLSSIHEIMKRRQHLTTTPANCVATGGNFVKLRCRGCHDNTTTINETRYSPGSLSTLFSRDGSRSLTLQTPLLLPLPFGSSIPTPAPPTIGGQRMRSGTASTSTTTSDVVSAIGHQASDVVGGQLEEASCETDTAVGDNDSSDDDDLLLHVLGPHHDANGAAAAPSSSCKVLKPSRLPHHQQHPSNVVIATNKTSADHSTTMTKERHPISRLMSMANEFRLRDEQELEHQDEDTNSVETASSCSDGYDAADDIHCPGRVKAYTITAPCEVLPAFDNDVDTFVGASVKENTKHLEANSGLMMEQHNEDGWPQQHANASLLSLLDTATESGMSSVPSSATVRIRTSSALPSPRSLRTLQYAAAATDESSSCRLTPFFDAQSSTPQVSSSAPGPSTGHRPLDSTSCEYSTDTQHHHIMGGLTAPQQQPGHSAPLLTIIG